MWIARDEDGSLWLFRSEPYKNGNVWENDGDYMKLPSDWYSQVRWEDEKPTEVELVILETENG